MVATSRITAFFERVLFVWDYCAGTVLITEAGGRATRFDGREIRLDDGASDFLGCPPGVHTAMVEELAQKWPVEHGTGASSA